MSIETPLTPAQEAAAEAQTAKEGGLRRRVVAFDIFCNVMFFNGQQGETISTHAGRAALEGKTWGIWLSRALNLIQKNHGEEARAGDIERAKNLLRIEGEK